MGRKDGVLRLLDRALEAQRALAASLSAEERAARGTLEHWSAKDTLAHIAAWQARLAHNIAAVWRGESLLPAGDLDETNAAIFQEHRDRPWDEVVAFCDSSHQQLRQALTVCTEAELARTDLLPWQGDRPLWRLIAGNGYVHPLMHLAQYYLGRGQGERAVALWEEALGHFEEVDTGPEWLGLIAAFQKHVLARYAGVLTRYHGAALSAGDHFLIVEQGPGTLTVRQPIGADTGLTLPLPPTWKAGDPIEVWAFGEQEQAIGKVSAAVTAQGITFTCRRWVSGQEVAYYRALNKGVRLGAFLPLVVSGLAE